MDIDEQLLSQNEEAKAGEFRASKRIQESEDIAQEGASFREQVQAKRGLNITTEKRAQELILRENPFRKMTDGWLRGAWTNLITSWGLTLLWIDFHVFLNKVFGPKYFRELGGEWIPSGIRKLEGAGMNKASSLAKIIEPIGCVGLNLLVIFLIISILTLISIITSILSGDVLVIWELFKGSIKALWDLFWGR